MTTSIKTSDTPVVERVETAGQALAGVGVSPVWRQAEPALITSIRPATVPNEHDSHLLVVHPGGRGVPECGYAGLL